MLGLSKGEPRSCFDKLSTNGDRGTEPFSQNRSSTVQPMKIFADTAEAQEIQALQDFIHWCGCETIEVEGKEVDASEYYRFVRIGEETDDNETEGWGFDIHIERTATY